MSIIDALPAVRGSLKSIPLSRLTWFKVGGPAVVFTPLDEEDLIHFLKKTPASIPIYPIGAGSNILVRDGGVDAVIVRLSKFSRISLDRETIVAQCGAMNSKLAKTTLQNSIEGFAFLSGIPGTIGGAIAMNAGAYGGEIKDILLYVKAITRQGERVCYPASQLNLSYRYCGVKDVFFTSASFKKSLGDFNTIKNTMDSIENARQKNQPIKHRTGGCTFKNPTFENTNHLQPYKAWQLIEKAGCRGRRVGGAKVSEQHCNFLINTGNATAEDLETLGEDVRANVKAKCGVQLCWEIQRWGKKIASKA